MNDGFIYSETISQRALARFPKPPAFPMDGEITAEMLFSTR